MRINDWSSGASRARPGFRQVVGGLFAASWVMVAVLMVAFGVFNPFYVFLMVMLAIAGYVEFAMPAASRRWRPPHDDTL